MRRQRMSYEEHSERHEARWYGTRCARYIEHAVFHAQEAARWRAVVGNDTLTQMWQARSDQNVADAVKYARSAAHHAGLALAARER